VPKETTIIAEFLISALGLIFLLAALTGGYFLHATRRIARDAERRVPPAGRFVEVNGARLHYLEAGQGRAVLFLHGLGAQSMQFRQTLFGDLSHDFHLVALDRPGSGYSTCAHGGNGIAEQATTIAGFIAALGLDRPLVVGHSLGGAVALALALDHPKAISGLVLLAPLSARHDKLRADLKGLLIPSPFKRWIVAQTIGVPMSLKYAQQTLTYIFAPQRPPRDYMVAGGGLLGLRPSHFYATSSDITAALGEIEAQSQRYEEIAVPTAIMFGAADHVLDHRVHGEPLATRIAGSRFDIAPGAGHMLPYAEPELVAAMVRETAQRASG
jgi:pimeloyl-ACP methyl ester carboxylesterase